MRHTDRHQLKAIARKIRRSVIKMSYHAKTGHIGTALSIVDILTVLYFRILRIRPGHVTRTRDRFILSKGHAAAALYATLAHRGFMPMSMLQGYCVDNGILGAHPDYNPKRGIELTTGSLGHGLSTGVGIAMGVPKGVRIVVLVSDAELNEGSTWEGIMFAAHHRLDNVMVIVDDNGQQAFGKTKDIVNLQPIEEKWKAFGWETKVVDGHDLYALQTVFTSVPFTSGRPSVVLAHTVSGKGVSFMERKVDWHYLPLNADLYKKALADIRRP